MKPVFSIAALSLLIVAGYQSPALAKKSYPMVCRGGGNMWVSVWNAKYATVTVHFTKASVGASQSPPRPGQCVWLDRGMRAEEPTELVFKGKANPFLELKVSASGLSVGRWGRGKSIYIIRAVQSGQLFYVHAYQYKNKKYGYNFFKITRVGP